MTRRSAWNWILAAAALGLGAGAAARADVTITETTKFDGIGERGWGASEGTETLVVSGDRLRQESTSKFTGKLMKRFGGEEGFRSATITRLDRRLMYMINFKEKSYQEWSFDQFKEMQEEVAEAISGQQPAPEERAPQEEPPVKCQPVKVEAKRTGESATIAGLQASRAVVTGKQTCENVQTKQTCEVVYTLDYWNAAPTPALQELTAFYRRQMDAMGVDFQQLEAVGRAARAMMSEGTEGLEGAMKELGKLEGFPVRNRITIEKGGDCGLGAGAEGGGPDAGSAMRDAFKGMFGKKKSGSEEAPSKAKGPGAASAPGLRRVFGMSSEVTSVTTSGAPADAFEPPPGFKKEAPPKLDAPQGP